MTKFSDWPVWLQIFVAVPHGALAFVMIWFWRPKTRRGWFWFVVAGVYLIIAVLVMHVVFKSEGG